MSDSPQRPLLQRLREDKPWALRLRAWRYLASARGRCDWLVITLKKPHTVLYRERTFRKADWQAARDHRDTMILSVDMASDDLTRQEPFVAQQLKRLTTGRP